MKPSTIQTMVSGLQGAVSRVGEATRVEGRKTAFVPYPVVMKARGFVRLPRSQVKPFANPWVPAEVAKAVELKEKAAYQRAAARKGWDAVMRELIDIDAAGLMHQARAMVAAEAEAKRLAELRAKLGVAGIEGRLWGDIMFPPLPLEDAVCRPLPAGRLTPPQLRAWVVEGYRNVRNARDARRYEAHVDGLRRDYFAQLPDCVFAPAVKREHDAAALVAYRAGFAALQAQRALREEIRVKSALRVDYQRQPFLYFRTRAEQQAAMRDLGREVKALERKLMPAAVTEVVLDGRLWPEAAGPASYATVLATGQAPKPVVVEVTPEAKAEAERIARWKKLNATATVASASREEWHVQKAVAKRPREVESDVDTGFNYWREQNY